MSIVAPRPAMTMKSSTPPRATRRPRSSGTSVDEAAAKLAARQHGVVTRRQLLGAGCSPRSLDRRVAAGRFRVIHRGIYGVGPIDPPAMPEMAATLACGPDSLVSHSSAARLWRILGDPERSTEVRVIVVGGDRRRPGIRIRRVHALPLDERTVLEGIPITTPARTLYDLASEQSGRALERVIAEAIALRLVSLDEVAATAERHRGCVGSGRLLASVRGDAVPDRTRSTAEERLLVLLRRAGVTAPRVNATVAGHEVDFHWPGDGLVVEVDGRAYHTSPHAFARDRRRDGDLAAAGLRVLRITWQDIVHRPEALLVKLGKALASGG